MNFMKLFKMLTYLKFIDHFRANTSLNSSARNLRNREIN